MEIQKISELDSAISNLLLYLHPEYLLPPYNNQLRKGVRFDIKMVEKYWIILTTIDWFTKKISKYELYFLDFYPIHEKISLHDALDHHIHAYLEDMETLKNKLVVFITNLKNDLKKISINKQEVDFAFKMLAKKTMAVFESSSKLRREHRHGDYRFVDSYVVDGQVADTIQINFKERLTAYGLEKLQKRKSDSLIQGKAWWSKNAAHNYTQIYGLANEVVERNKKFLYDLLDIYPISTPKSN